MISCDPYTIAVASTFAFTLINAAVNFYVRADEVDAVVVTRYLTAVVKYTME